MKKIFKRIILPLNLVLIAVVCIYSVVVAIKKANDYEIYTRPTIEPKIYTVWQVETFEGGGKSRITYLKKIAREIESENEGVLIMVKMIDPARLSDELLVSTPDIISFGYGVGNTILPKLIELNSTYNVRDNLLESGMFNNKVYALPYIVSGYAMITHSTVTKNFHCGQNAYIKPSAIYQEKGLTPVEEETQYEAYKDFVYDTKVTLLGSGRDVYRVNNLNNIGRTTATITPIDSYTDLIQYIGIIKKDDITSKFISLSLDKKHQTSLTEYSLFSSTHTKLYSSGLYKDMENAILNCAVPKVFYE